MTFSSRGRLRGWSLALGLAIILTGVLWSLLNLSQKLGPEYYHSRRTTHIVSATTKAPPNIATQNIRMEPVETQFEFSTDEWEAYRSRPASTLVSIVEPTRTARLAAPIQMPDVAALESAIAHYQRSAAGTNATTSNSVVSYIPGQNFGNQDSLNGNAISKPYFSQLNFGNSTKLSGWPQPVGLLRELNQIIGESESISSESDDAFSIRPWALEIRDSLTDLSTCNSLSDPRVEEILNSLEVSSRWLLDEVLPKRLELDHRQLATKVAFGLSRRVEVWKSVYRCIYKTDFVVVEKSSGIIDMHEIGSAISQVIADSLKTGDADGWRQFLVLDDLTSIANGSVYEVGHATVTAQTFLNRVLFAQVSSVQREFLDSSSVRQLATLLQPMAASPVDFRSLLSDLEMLEADSEHRARISLVSAMHSLRYAEDPDQVAVSQAIEKNYRNSNVRIALSAALINRLLPKDKLTKRPVHQIILGADTRGTSDINTTLQVKLIPDPNAWNLQLALDGKVQSSTRSSRGPANFYNASQTAIASSRTLKITPNGIDIQGSTANVRSKDSLRGLDTDFDGLPIVGEMVRYFAHREFNEQRGPARKIMQRVIATQTDQEFDSQLNSNIKQASNALDQRLLGPLRSLNLNPSLTDLSTTSDRLIARYRIACDDCLGASTPRPQAPGDSLLSMQMHQSAMNNGFSQIGLSNKQWTLAELGTKIAEQLGQDPKEVVTQDVPEDVVIQFADDRPVTMEFLEGRMWLTLRIAKLSQPGRIELSDFVIRTSYVPAINGLDAALVRDGAISVDGDRLSIRERLPLRAIFARVFAARPVVPLVSPQLLSDSRAEGLAVSQIIMEDGWLAIAISESQSPHVALLNQQQTVR
ncbi:MAG: hypothetical protein NTW52_10920 [Planctomycetota bacterium]|nr:hypothetical protein [Planctomycetota bacterium]